MAAPDFFENFLLHNGLKTLRPQENPLIVPLSRQRRYRQADTPQAALFRLWGRGGLSPSPPVGALPRPRLCQRSLCRKITRNARKQRVPCEGFSPVIPCLFRCF